MIALIISAKRYIRQAVLLRNKNVNDNMRQKTRFEKLICEAMENVVFVVEEARRKNSQERFIPYCNRD